MQIIPLPVPVSTSASVNTQAINQALPQFQALAAAPISDRAVTPTSKKERGRKSRNNNDRAKGGDNPPEPGSSRGHIVNTSA